VSDDKGHDNGCDESTSQDQCDDSTTKASVVTDNQPINNEQGTETKSRARTKRERFAKDDGPTSKKRRCTNDNENVTRRRE